MLFAARSTAQAPRHLPCGAMTAKKTAPKVAKRKPKATARAKASPTTRVDGAPDVRLGHIASNGVSASMFGLIDRGTGKRPRIARSMRGNVEIRFKESFAPVRIAFGADGIVVGDAPADEGEKWPVDLRISGSLPDVVHLASAPLFGGVPRPTNPRGRAAIARFAKGSVKVEGSPLLARRLLRLLEI